MCACRQEEASHQEAAERVHAVHEGDEGQGGGRVYAQGECSHQPDPRQKGKYTPHALFSQNFSVIFYWQYISVLIIRNNWC